MCERWSATPVNIPFKAPYRFAYGSTASLTKTIVEVETAMTGQWGLVKAR